jgi:hypothetical protein
MSARQGCQAVCLCSDVHTVSLVSDSGTSLHEMHCGKQKIVVVFPLWRCNARCPGVNAVLAEPENPRALQEHFVGVCT